ECRLAVRHIRVRDGRLQRAGRDKRQTHRHSVLAWQSLRLMRTRALPLLLMIALAGCHTTAPFVADRLFFGRNIPAGGTVSEAQWEEFVRDVVTPRFPKGLTVWQGKGQWLDPRGSVVREDVYVVEILHDPVAADEAAIG